MTKSAKKQSGKYDRPWEIEVGKMGRTEMLSRWIHNMRSKQRTCDLRRNFRVRAMLSHAATKAEHELRSKQLLRIRRWKKLRKELLKGIEYGSCGAFNMAEQEDEKSKQLPTNKKSDWQKIKSCEDLNSLDNFLQQFSSSPKPQMKLLGDAISAIQLLSSEN